MFLFSSRRRHTSSLRDWSSDVCSSDLPEMLIKLTRERQWIDRARRVWYPDALLFRWIETESTMSSFTRLALSSIGKKVLMEIGRASGRERAEYAVVWGVGYVGAGF